MAKSDSFFIRGIVGTSSGFTQSEIDLGSFVNLGVSKSTLLRIHSVEVQYSDDAGVRLVQGSVAVQGGTACWQLTTQTQTALVTIDDKSIVASGRLAMFGYDSSFMTNNDHLDVGPQNWKNGYLIGVDSLFLGSNVGGTITSGDMNIAIILECTLETATQASSMALALSQQ